MTKGLPVNENVLLRYIINFMDTYTYTITLPSLKSFPLILLLRYLIVVLCALLEGEIPILLRETNYPI